MYKQLDTLSLSLLHTGYIVLDQRWNYENVISPFSRIYYITEGAAIVKHNDSIFELKPDHLYLIPAYTKSQYQCEQSMSQFYINFLDSMSGGAGIFDVLNFNYEVQATSMDKRLFEKLLEINPNISIEKPDPKEYDNKPELLSYNFNHRQLYYKYVETKGILGQILSRFIDPKTISEKQTQSWHRLSKVVHFILENLEHKITVEDLANSVHLNADYFSRLFLEIKGERPIDFINNKRLEKAQLMLNTTEYNISEIARKVGFQHVPYFTRTFKRKFGLTPGKYRKSNWKI